ncbi:urease accessory protein UreE [Ferruginibacter sp. SUN002]|uniref:urease accessory protein UreE n=1 Tax=Ferruginibacter sp. SUN002 TaxID=2937789 RepID=UPI003D35AC46
MIIKEKIGNLNSFTINNQKIDHLQLEWFETNKRILHKKTQTGIELVLKFLQENQQLTQGDILYQDESTIIVVDIKGCDVLVIKPNTMFEMASICYEIGNKHLPLFYENDELLIPFEQPIYKLLTAQGYNVQVDKRKLLQPLKTTVLPHGSSETLFSKILKLTTTNE